VVDIKIDDLDKEWTNLFKYISKKATIKRKNLLNKHIIKTMIIKNPPNKSTP